MTLLICLLSIFLSTGAERPDLPVDTLKLWNIAADKIALDPLGQYYIVIGGSLVKYNTEGDSVYSWSDPQTGRIRMVDTGDPMRILVYQKDFNLVRFLNNRLAPISGPINLDDLGITAPLALALSHQGGFWVIDGSSFRLRHLDQQLKTIVESKPLDLSPAAGSPDFQLIESGDQVLLLIPGKEIQVFDLFGTLIKKIPLKVVSFNTCGERILLVYPDKITLWKDPVTPEEKLITDANSDIREACLFQNKLLIRKSVKVILISR